MEIPRSTSKEAKDFNIETELSGDIFPFHTLFRQYLDNKLGLSCAKPREWFALFGFYSLIWFGFVSFFHMFEYLGFVGLV